MLTYNVIRNTIRLTKEQKEMEIMTNYTIKDSRTNEKWDKDEWQDLFEGLIETSKSLKKEVEGNTSDTMLNPEELKELLVQYDEEVEDFEYIIANDYPIGVIKDVLFKTWDSYFLEVIEQKINK